MSFKDDLPCKIFVGNLPVDLKEEEVIKLFEVYGKVRDFFRKQPIDPSRKRSFGFVTFSSRSAAERAIEGLKNHPLNLSLNFAKDDSRRFKPNEQRDQITRDDTSDHCRNNKETYNKCDTCGEVAFLNCTRCHTWFCCISCQETDCSRQGINDKFQRLVLDEEKKTKKSDEPSEDENQRLVIDDEKNMKKFNESSSPKTLEFALKENEHLVLLQSTLVMIAENLGNFQYSVILKSNYLKVLEFSSLLECSDAGTFRPMLNAFCGAKFGNEWYRAQILELIPEIKVRYIDFGNTSIVTMKELKKLPVNAMKIKAQAIKIKLHEGTPNEFGYLEAGKELCVICCEVEKTTHIVMIDGVDVGQLKNVTAPNSWETHLKYVDFEGGQGLITHAMTTADLMLRPLNNETLQYLKEVTVSLSNNFLKPWDTSCIPDAGQILAAKFAVDELYYRAVVKDSHNAEEILVRYIDFGNEQYVSVNDIRYIPQEITEIPCLAKPIVLRNVPRMNNKNVRAFLKQIIDKEEQVFVQLSGSEDHIVDLFSAENEHLNVFINEMMGHFSKAELDVPIPTFKCGQNVNLYVHAIFLDYQEIAATTTDHYLTLCQFKDEIRTSCESLAVHVPQEGEVCFGFYQGEWVRCCVSKICDNEGVVKLLDFGTSGVLHNFRKMDKAYFKLEAGGLRCQIHGLSGKITAEERVIIKSFLHPRSTIVASVIEQKGLNLSIVIPCFNQFLEKRKKYMC